MTTNILLKHKANPSLGDSNWMLPLHLATNQGEVEVMEVLLDKGADVNCLDRLGNTAMHLALILHKVNKLQAIKILRLLHKRNINVSIRNKEGYSLVHLAVLFNSVDVVSWMLQTNKYFSLSPP